jgi:NTP pyrophosphatase (non-canonical NTP hydrolase)
MSERPSLRRIQTELREFVAERDWDQFHNPKNLVMALAGECGELMEHFQWLTPEQAQSLSADERAEVAMEIADVFLFLLRLADRLEVDLLGSAARKLALNRQKYPVDKAKGRATKYDRL